MKLIEINVTFDERDVSQVRLKLAHSFIYIYARRFIGSLVFSTQSTVTKILDDLT